jgi:sugar phosphate isomerase/epimerase
VKLCTSSWSFAECSLKEAIGITQVLGIDACDLGYFYGPALEMRAVLSRPVEYAEQIKNFGIKVPSFYHLFGNNFMDRNLANPKNLEANLLDLPKVLQFCNAIECPVLFILPGIVNPGQSRDEAFKVSLTALKAMLPIAQVAGIALSIEPHVHSYLESPQMVLDLLGEIPGLKLILDYTHFTCLGYRQEEIDPLAPHAAHVHLRQARPGILQAKMNQGTLNFSALLGTLQKCGYQGYLALEAVHQDYMNTVYDDVLTEIIKMRNFVNEYLGLEAPQPHKESRF